MSNDERIPIKIKLGDKEYPLKVLKQEEEKVQKAVQWINDKLSQYKGRYSGMDVSDFMAMTALQLAKDNIGREEQEGSEPLNGELVKLNIKLDDYLKSIQEDFNI